MNLNYISLEIGLLIMQKSQIDYKSPLVKIDQTNMLRIQLQQLQKYLLVIEKIQKQQHF